MNTTKATATEPVLKNLDRLIPDLEALYKDIHAHPELSMQETRTAGLAADRLRAAGYAVTSGVGKTGVVGLLRNGDGPIVMLRADMDALPIEEATGLPYASKATRKTARERRSRLATCAATTCTWLGSWERRRFSRKHARRGAGR
jgi:hypothetical protein